MYMVSANHDQFHPHYDGRFADKVMPEAERRIALTALLRSYLSAMHDIGADTWIMHGSLLGWWWNRKIMPWDSDIDVQISERSIIHLARYYNMTVHHYHFDDLDEQAQNIMADTDAERVKSSSRSYMLEVNPNYINGSTADRLNMIDARWIDRENGLFIDITTLRRDVEMEAQGHYGRMMCKDKHQYLEEDIFPLRESVFENVPVRIPFAYSELLIEEYGPQSLASTVFQGYRFDESKREWLPLP
jgi:hypothetical protein